MAKTAGVHLPTWEQLSPIPGYNNLRTMEPFDQATGLYWDKGDFLYCHNGGVYTQSRRYNLKYDAWERIENIGDGGHNNQTYGNRWYWDASASVFYLKGTSTNWDKWDPATSTLTALTSGAEATTYGGRIFDTDTGIHASGNNDYVYFFTGYADTSFYRYSISGNSWSSMANLPEAMMYVGWLPAVDPLKFYAISRDQEKYYDYTIATNTWSASSEWNPNLDDQGPQYGGFCTDDTLASSAPGTYAYVAGVYPLVIQRLDFSTGTTVPFRQLPTFEFSFTNYPDPNQLCYAETGGKKWLYYMITGVPTSPSYYMFRTEIF